MKTDRKTGAMGGVEFVNSVLDAAHVAAASAHQYAQQCFGRGSEEYLRLQALAQITLAMRHGYRDEAERQVARFFGALAPDLPPVAAPYERAARALAAYLGVDLSEHGRVVSARGEVEFELRGDDRWEKARSDLHGHALRRLPPASVGRAYAAAREVVAARARLADAERALRDADAGGHDAALLALAEADL